MSQRRWSNTAYLSLVIADPEALSGVDNLPAAEWRSGHAAVLEVVEDGSVDVVVNAIVGSAGLEATLAALRAGKRLALANKESLVAGGPLVIEAAREGGGELIPIDSEHSAILQCLEGHDPGSVARLVLDGLGRTLSRIRAGRAGGRRAGRCPLSSDVGYGRQNFGRLSYSGQQGTRGHRGPFSLRDRLRQDRGHRTSTIHRSLFCRVHRRLGARATRLPDDGVTDPVCVCPIRSVSRMLR